MSELTPTTYQLSGITISKLSGPHWAFSYHDTIIMADILYSSGTTETAWSLYGSTTSGECITKRGEVTGGT